MPKAYMAAQLARPMATADAFAAAHRGADGAIALQEDYLEPGGGRLTGRDEPSWPPAHHDDIRPLERHATSGAGTSTRRGTIASAPTGHGAMHF